MTNSVQNSKPIDPKKEERVRSRLDINSTLVLSIAALAITWCTYQSNLWNGIQTFRLARSNTANRKAQETKLTAEQHKQMDETVLISFMNAVIDKNQERVDFYLRRARPEIASILSRWLLQKPLTNPNAAIHPMAMEEYKALMKKDLIEVEKFRKQGDEYWDDAQKANSNADKYVLFTVIFSMVMFLGAIGTKMTHIRVSFGLIILSGFICMAILVFIFLFMPMARE